MRAAQLCTKVHGRRCNVSLHRPRTSVRSIALTPSRRWKSQTSATIDRLKSAVEQLLLRNNLPNLADCGTVSSIPTTNPDATIQTLSPFSCPSNLTDRDFTAEGPLNTNQDNSDLIPLPMNNLYSLADAKNSHLIRVDPGDANGPDLIDQGVISLDEADFLFGHFRDHINPLLWVFYVRTRLYNRSESRLRS